MNDKKTLLVAQVSSIELIRKLLACSVADIVIIEDTRFHPRMRGITMWIKQATKIVDRFKYPQFTSPNLFITKGYVTLECKRVNTYEEALSMLRDMLVDLEIIDKGMIVEVCKIKLEKVDEK